MFCIFTSYSCAQNLIHKVTRKSSCVNARGIPTAAYQVLHLLSCTRWGNPPPQSGLPPPQPGPTWGGGYPRRGTPQRGLTGGYPRWGTPGQVWLGGYPQVGVPPMVESPLAGVPPGWGTPHLDLTRVPPGHVWLGGVTPPPSWNWLGYRWVDGWTDTCENITFPSYYVRGR